MTPPPGARIITCNAGSSNTKLACYDASSLQLLSRAKVTSQAEALRWITAQTGGGTVSFGHRVVHGGKRYTTPQLIDNENFAMLRELIPLAPLHQPANLNLIGALRSAFPGTRHVACFDTAFHHTLPELERRLPLPEAFHEHGIERYGFHGLSYEYIASRLLDVLGPVGHGRVVVAHLGNGASVCGMEDRTSRATSMGFSTLDGVMMGTRCGALDPGVILHLLEHEELSVDDVSSLLYHGSGLKGVSGISNDVRELLKSDDPRAREALDLFAASAAKTIGGIVAMIGGIDALVFTGGIGEHAGPVRAAICDYFLWLGLMLDKKGNDANEGRISSAHSLIPVYVIPTDEESVIAKACREYAAA